MFVKITVEEMGRAISVGYERFSCSVRDKRKDKLFEKNWMDGFLVHVHGAIGEIAAAKAIGIYPSLHVNEFRGGKSDLPHDIEVRHRTKAGYDLIIRGSDREDRIYVLTRGEPPDIEVAGWCNGKEFCTQKNWKNYGGHGSCWFIPADDLRPMEDLIKIILRNSLDGIPNNDEKGANS